MLNTRFEEWRNGRTSYLSSEVPEDLRAFGNDERAQLELYDFMRERPGRYFCYYEGDAETGQLVTNWTGLQIGRITSAGAAFRSNFGDRRRHVTVRAINGLTYRGMAQLDAGNYVRLRAVKQ